MPTIKRYLPGGGVRTLYPPGDESNGPLHRRASRVEPCCPPLRWLFRLIRLFGDQHPLARWTRSWRCYWRVRMLLGNRAMLGPFPRRDAALQAEHDWLYHNWILETFPCRDSSEEPSNEYAP